MSDVRDKTDQWKWIMLRRDFHGPVECDRERIGAWHDRARKPHRLQDIPSRCFGIDEVRISNPSAVMTTLSSIRTPMPRSRSGVFSSRDGK